MTKGLALAALVVMVSATAHADSIGPCPPGEHVVMNPTQPGAMHHGGFHCEPGAETPPATAAPAAAPATAAPAASSGCAIALASSGDAWLLALGIAALALARRR
jgi:hypothetical protein